MDRQTILNEINRRKNITSGFSLSDIEEEIRKRQKSPYGNIVDDMDVPEGNARTEAIEEYLKSPEFRRLALEIGGGVAGAMTGGTLFAATKLMRPALGLLYRSLGAGIGEGAAAGAAQTFDPREDLAKEIFRGFATGMSAETIGAAIPAIIKKIGFKGLKYTKEAQDAEEILTATKGKLPSGTSKVDDTTQGLITPGIGSDNRYIDVLENVAEKSLFGGGKIIKSRKGAENLMTNEVGAFIDTFSDATTRVNAGQLAIDAVQNSLDAFRANAKVRYDALTTAAKGVTVDISSTKKIAEKLLKEAKPTELLEKDGIKVLQTIKNLDNTVSFSVANNVRSKLLGVSRSSKDLIKGQGARYAQNVTESLTKNIDNANYLLKEFDKFGKETLEQIYTKEEIKSIRSLFNALEVAQRKTVGEGIPGGMFIQLSQAGAVFGLASGIMTAPSAAILLTPAIVGKMFTNPKIIGLMKKGFQLNPGSPSFYRNSSQIIAAMVSNNLISEDEAEDFLEDLENSK
jgi:hypothetical protein